MKKIHITSPFEFAIKIDDKTFFLSKTEYVEICDFDKKKLTIFAYPTGEICDSLPYAVSLDFDKKISQKSVNFYEFSNRFEIELLPYFLPKITPICNKILMLSKEKYDITCYGDRIKITTKNQEYLYFVQGLSPTFGKFGEKIFVQVFDKNKKHLVCFDTKSCTFFEICGEQIEILQNEIKCLKYFPNCINRKILSTYSFDFENTKTEFFEDKFPKKNIPTSLVPFEFFDAVKMKDYAFLKNITSKSLYEKLSKETLEQFFDNLQNVKLHSLSPLVYSVYYVGFAKDYQITMQDGLIFDIEEL
jgi:hypothetical protein